MRNINFFYLVLFAFSSLTLSSSLALFSFRATDPHFFQSFTIASEIYGDFAIPDSRYKAETHGSEQSSVVFPIVSREFFSIQRDLYIIP